MNFLERLGRLEAVVSEQAQDIKDLISLNQSLLTQFTELQDICDGLMPETKLPILRTLIGSTARIVKIRVDLFDNKGKGKGVPLWDFKTFVWFDKKIGKSGSIRPLHFWGARAGSIDVMAYDQSLYAQIVRNADSDDMIARLTHRGKTKNDGEAEEIKGTKQDREHVIAMGGRDLFIHISDEFEARLEFDGNYQPDKPNSPVKKWWWNKT
jgi:hypothetical protein